MHRIDAADHVQNTFSRGDPLTGRPGTIVSADWLNAVQEELVNALEGAGVPLNKADNAQLAAAFLGVELTPGGTILGKIYVRRLGKTVTVHGVLTNVGGSVAVDGVIVNIPAGYRPAAGLPQNPAALAASVSGAAFSQAQGINAIRVIREGGAGAGDLRWMGPTAFGGLVYAQFSFSYRCD
jgi:hypothetical protein